MQITHYILSVDNPPRGLLLTSTAPAPLKGASTNIKVHHTSLHHSLNSHFGSLFIMRMIDWSSKKNCQHLCPRDRCFSSNKYEILKNKIFTPVKLYCYCDNRYTIAFHSLQQVCRADWKALVIVLVMLCQDLSPIVNLMVPLKF